MKFLTIFLISFCPIICKAQEKTTGKVIVYRTDYQDSLIYGDMIVTVIEEISHYFYPIVRPTETAVSFYLFEVNDTVILSTTKNKKEKISEKVVDGNLYIYKIRFIPRKFIRSFGKPTLIRVPIHEFKNDAPKLYKILGLENN